MVNCSFYSERVHLTKTAEVIGSSETPLQFITNGTQIPDSIFTEIEELSERFVIPYKWQQGDIVLVDNHTVLHGRNSYDPKEEREILVRMGIKPSNPAHFLFEPKKLENAS